MSQVRDLEYGVRGGREMSQVRGQEVKSQESGTSIRTASAFSHSSTR